MFVYNGEKLVGAVPVREELGQFEVVESFSNPFSADFSYVFVSNGDEAETETSTEQFELIVADDKNSLQVNEAQFGDSIAVDKVTEQFEPIIVDVEKSFQTKEEAPLVASHAVRSNEFYRSGIRGQFLGCKQILWKWFSRWISWVRHLVIIPDFCLDENKKGAKAGGRKRNKDKDLEDGRNGIVRDTTSNHDDSSSTTTKPMSSISPNWRIKPIISRWRKGCLLGSGSFGKVYEGFAEEGFFFAVKEVSLLDESDKGRQCIIQLQKEIALLGQFEHENIVQYYGTKMENSCLYIFLDLAKGSLRSIYEKYTLTDPQVSSYTRQILHGLKYLHDRNIVHRDIKCANILLYVNGLVKLADFGLAKATRLNDGMSTCKGTPFWMAPEVVKKKGKEYGIAADIWSLGCTGLEMLTGKFPFSENGPPVEPVQVLYKLVNGERPHIPDTLSNDARDFILKCLQVDPSSRPSAAQLLDHPFVTQSLPSSSG